jgi:ABC-2 type transport system ATP-binding protein
LVKPEAAAAVRARGLRFRNAAQLLERRPREVLAGIDLEVPSGSAIGLIGPNGSGKSTLLRLMAGVVHPSAGTLEVLGGTPRSASVRARIGFLPEGSPFPGELSAQAALRLAASLGNRARPQSRAMELLERVGLSDSSTVPLSRFSHGMLRRFGLAHALVSDPALLLLDEPTAGLDAEGYRVLDEILREQRERGTTLVLATHQIADLYGYTAHAAVLVEGNIVCAGEPSQLLGEPSGAAQVLMRLYARDRIEPRIEPPMEGRSP